MQTLPPQWAIDQILEMRDRLTNIEASERSAASLAQILNYRQSGLVRRMETVESMQAQYVELAAQAAAIKPYLDKVQAIERTISVWVGARNIMATAVIIWALVTGRVSVETAQAIAKLITGAAP